MRPNDRARRRRLRHHRLRARLFGTSDRPRLAVYRSLRHVYAQLIDDTAGKTIAAASSLSGEIRTSVKHGGNKDSATRVGALLAKRAVELGITRVCFDRSGFVYHGCVEAVAESARKEGLKF